METSNPRTARDWSGYYEAMENKPLHPTYSLIDPYLKPGQRAIELGFGIGHGVVHLLSKGLEVTGIDAEAEALERLQKRLPAGSKATLVQSNFQSLQLMPKGYEIVIAGFSLFFLNETEFNKFWPDLVESLKTGGVFMGQFLGPNDDWADENHSFHDNAQVHKLLEKFEILSLEEAERDGETAQGIPKHWHVFHVLARKI